MYVASLTGMTREKRNHIRHHQPQKPTVRESGVAPVAGGDHQRGEDCPDRRSNHRVRDGCRTTGASPPRTDGYGMMLEGMAQTLILVHAVFGGLALLLGAIALVARKGKTLHKRAGKGILLLRCWLPRGTALVVSILPNHESPFLFSIGVFSSYFVISGFRSIRFRLKGVQPGDRSMAGLRDHDYGCDNDTLLLGPGGSTECCSINIWHSRHSHRSS